MNKFTTGSDNIFADLGLSEPAERAYKSDLAIAIARDIESRGWKQQEAAEVLGVNPSTLSRQCSAGQFPHVRIGRSVRIPIAEVDRLERGEPSRTSMMDVPDYVTGTPSMFDTLERTDP